MIVLGIDPGATTGWCAYDGEGRRALASGCFRDYRVDHDVMVRARMPNVVVVIERPKGYGPTRPELVDCGYVCGRLAEQFDMVNAPAEITRIDVKNALRTATHGEVPVKNDSGVWAALLLLHGGESAAKKGGPLHGVRSHGRAALAVAVAWCLMRTGQTQ